MVIGWFEVVVVVQKCGFWWMEVLFGRWKPQTTPFATKRIYLNE